MEGYVGYNHEVTQKQSRNMLLVVRRLQSFVTLTIFLMKLWMEELPQMMASEWITRSQGDKEYIKPSQGLRMNLIVPFKLAVNELNIMCKAGINLFPLVKWDLVIRRLLPVCCLALTGADPTETVGPGSWPNKPDLMKRKLILCALY